jgi:hypothetical protein
MSGKNKVLPKSYIILKSSQSGEPFKSKREHEDIATLFPLNCRIGIPFTLHRISIPSPLLLSFPTDKFSRIGLFMNTSACFISDIIIITVIEENQQNSLILKH